MGPDRHVNAPLTVKEVNWGKFTIGSAVDGTGETDIRCSDCGKSWAFEVASLPELSHWAVQHECPLLTVD